MKKLLVLGLLTISLIACKKKEKPTEEAKTVAPTTTAVSDKTVTIMCQGSQMDGVLKVIWEYEDLGVQIDSVYQYSQAPTYFTKVVHGDSMRVYFRNSSCGTCSPTVSDVIITVNGIQKKIWSNDLGCSYLPISIN